MADIERRILELDFDNADFQKGVQSTLDGLARLRKALALDDVSDGFGKIEKQAQSITFKSLHAALEHISNKFSELSKSASDDLAKIEKSSESLDFASINKNLESVSSKFAEAAFAASDEFSRIEKSVDAVNLTGFVKGLESISDEFARLSENAAQELSKIDRSVDSVNLQSLSNALDLTSGWFGKMSKVAADEFAAIERSLTAISFRSLEKQIDAITGQFAKIGRGVSEELSRLEKSVNSLDFTPALRTIDLFGEQLSRTVESSVDEFSRIERAINGIDLTPFIRQIDELSEVVSRFSTGGTEAVSKLDSAFQNVSVDNVSRATESISEQVSTMAINTASSISDISDAARKVDLSSIEQSVDVISDRFSNFGIIATTVLAKLTTSAMDAGGTLARKIIEPIFGGGFKRAMDIENAHFTLQGLISDEAEVQAIMQQAMDSVDGTAFAYNDAAKAASQFAATGLRSGADMERSLRAIAGVAATTNSSYADISDIFTTVAGNNRLLSIQLNQLSYRGMNGAATLTKAFNDVLHGSSNLSADMQQHIRDLVQYGMSEISDFSGSLEGITEYDLRQLVSKGRIDFNTFSAVMAETFGDHAKDANKTFSGSMSNIRAALARTGAMFFSDLIVQEGPMVKMFNAIREAVNDFNKALKPVADAFVSFVSGIAGRVQQFFEVFHETGAMSAIGGVFEGLVDILRAVRDGFTTVFPPKAREQIKAGVEQFKRLLETLRPSEATLSRITRISSGLFSVIKIGVMIVKSVLKVIGSALKALAPVGRLIADVAARLGDFLTYAANSLEQADTFGKIAGFIQTAFGYIGKGLETVIDGIKTFFGWIAQGANSMQPFHDLAKRVADRFSYLTQKTNETADAMSRFTDRFSGIKDFFRKIADTLGKFFGGIWTSIKDRFESAGVDGVFSFLNSTLFTALLGGVVKIAHNLSSTFKSLSGTIESFQAIPNSLSESLGNLFGVLQQGQQNLLPKTLIAIAVAIGILAASLFMLSGLDWDSMLVGLVGMVGVLAEMMIFLKVVPTLMESAFSKVKSGQMIAFASQIVLLGIAMLLLSSAVKKLSKLDWTGLLKGLVGLLGIMAIVVGSVKGLSSVGKGIGRLAGQLVILALAINMLVLPVKALSSLGVKDLAKGLGGLAGILGVLVAFSKLMKDTKFVGLMASRLLVLSVAVGILAISVKSLSKIPVTGLVKGLGSVMTMIYALSIFLKSVNAVELRRISGVLLALGISMLMLSGSMTTIAKMDAGKVVQGLAAIGGVLAEFSIFFRSLSGLNIAGIAGEIGMLSLALTGITGAMTKIANLDWVGVSKALVGIGGALLEFVIFYAMIENLTSTADSLKVSVLVTSLVPLVLALSLFSLLPLKGIIGSLIGLGGAFVLLAGGLKMVASVPPGTIMKLAAALLSFGVSVGAVGLGIGAAAAGLALFTGAMAVNAAALPYIAQQIAKSIVGFFTALANSSSELVTALGTLLSAVIKLIADKVPEILDLLGLLLREIVRVLLENIPYVANGVLQIISGILQAIAENIAPIVKAGLDIITGLLRGLELGMGPLVDQAFKTVIAFINGLANAIRANYKALFDAAMNLITAILEALVAGIMYIFGMGQQVPEAAVQGMEAQDYGKRLADIAWSLVSGLAEAIANLAFMVVDAVVDLGQKALDAICGFFGIHSPSRVMGEVGENIGEGLAIGVESTSRTVEESGEDLADSLLSSFEDNATEAGDAGEQLTQALSDGVQFTNAQMSRLENMYGKTFVDAIFGTMDEQFEDQGESASESFASGISEGRDEAKNQTETIANETVETVTCVEPEMRGAGEDASSAYSEGIATTSSEAEESAKTVSESAVGGLDESFKTFKDTGVKSAETYADSITDVSAYSQGAELSGTALSGIGNDAKSFEDTGVLAATGYSGGLNAPDALSGAYSGGFSLGGMSADGMGAGMDGFDIKAYIDEKYGSSEVSEGAYSAGEAVGESMSEGIIDGMERKYNEKRQNRVDLYKKTVRLVVPDTEIDDEELDEKANAYVSNMERQYDYMPAAVVGSPTVSQFALNSYFERMYDSEEIKKKQNEFVEDLDENQKHAIRLIHDMPSAVAGSPTASQFALNSYLERMYDNEGIKKKQNEFFEDLGENQKKNAVRLSRDFQLLQMAQSPGGRQVGLFEKMLGSEHDYGNSMNKFKTAFGGLAKTLESAFGNGRLDNTVGGAVDSAANAAKDRSGIFNGAGQNLMNTMSEGVKSAMPWLSTSATKAQSSALTGIQRMFPKFGQAGKDTSTNIATGVSAPQSKTGISTAAVTVAQTALNKLKELNPKFTASGKTAGSNIGAGLGSANAGIRTSADKAGWAGINALSGLHSRFNEAGINSGLNFGWGLGSRDANNNARNSGLSVAASGMNAAGEYERAFADTGSYLTGGFARGMSDTWRVRNVMYSVAQTAVDVLRGALGISSPSKVFMALGEFCDVGFVNGITAGASDAANATASFGETAVSAMNGALNGSIDAMDEWPDPVIRPIVDLSDVLEAGASISDMMDGQLGLQTTSRLAQAAVPYSGTPITTGLSSGAISGTTVYNTYIDGAIINSDAEIRACVDDTLRVLRRKEQM